MLLTIAIPTYNHHNLLLEQVISILPQLNDEVNLFIVDNNSMPDVKSFLISNKIDVNLIKFIKNKRNIGGNENILKCINLTDSHWVWVLSDNDILRPDAIGNVINTIKLNNNCCFLNFDYPYTKYGEGLTEFCSNAYYVNSFTISNCIYNTQFLFQHLHFFKSAISTHLGQLIFVLKYMELNSSSSFVLSNIKLYDKSLPAEWSKKKFVVDSLNFYDFFSGDALKVIYQSRFGKQILGMQVLLLALSKSKEKTSIFEVGKIFVQILKRSSFYQIFSLNFFRSLLTLILVCFYTVFLKKS